MFEHKLFLYFGLIYALFEFIRLLPPAKARLLKMVQLIVLILTNLIIIAVFDTVNIYLGIGIFVVTMIFTLVPTLLNMKLNKAIFKSLKISDSKLPEIIYALNRDKYSKSKITLKKTFIELRNGHLENALRILADANKDRDLKSYYPWHYDVLFILISTRNLNIAGSYLSTLNIDMKSKNIPPGLLYSMVRIYSEFGNFKKASDCLKYLDEHYHDIQHRNSNLLSYLVFYALAGCETNFDLLLSRYPRMRSIKQLPYWRSILYFKTGKTDIAVSMLRQYLRNLPIEHRNYATFIKSIIENPLVYKPATEEQISIAEETFPKDEKFKTLNMFNNSNNKSKISATLVLCIITALLTLVQFIIMGGKSISDLFFLNSQGLLDFIRVGAFSPELVDKGQFVRYTTSIFLHGGWLHLAFNMYGLFIIGRLVEKAFGKAQLVFTFLISGIIGNIFTYFFMQNNIVGVGASGGVFGVFGLLGVYVLWRRKDINRQMFKNLIFNFAIIIGINIFYGLSTPEINNMAHLGGFIGGILCALLYILIADYLKVFMKAYKVIIAVISGIIFIGTLALWYPLINYDYFADTELEKHITIRNYSADIPNIWEVKDIEAGNKQIYCLYTGSQIYISEETLPISDINAEVYFTKYMDEIIKELGLKEKEPIIQNDLEKINNDWYYFVLNRWSKDLNAYYYAYYYFKVFPKTICVVISYEFDSYTEDFRKIFTKFLKSIEEN